MKMRNSFSYKSVKIVRLKDKDEINTQLPRKSTSFSEVKSKADRRGYEMIWIKTNRRKVRLIGSQATVFLLEHVERNWRQAMSYRSVDLFECHLQRRKSPAGTYEYEHMRSAPMTVRLAGYKTTKWRSVKQFSTRAEEEEDSYLLNRINGCFSCATNHTAAQLRNSTNKFAQSRN